MTKSELTSKQEKFCQEVASGKTLRDSYIASYNTSKMQDSTINELASKLNADHKITARISELTNKAAEKVVHTLEESLLQDKKIIERYEKCLDVLNDEKSTENALKAAQRTIRYIGAAAYNGAKDRLNRISGHYEKDNEQKQQSVITTFELPNNNRD